MKHTPRFYSPNLDISRKTISLSDGQVYKKMHNVLRMVKGDTAIITDGKGKIFRLRLDLISSAKITGEIIEKIPLKNSLRFHLTLAQAMPKGNKMEEIVKMGTEVGVSEFIFFESKYSVVKKKNFKTNKLERLQKIIIESSLQSERDIFPVLSEPATFDEVITRTEREILMHSRVVDQSQDLQKIKKGIEDDQKLTILIGPEGGFSNEEIAKAVSEGCLIAHLNLPILRTETAGAVISGIILA
ncbi:16S rRNA (uracil(1498)-N(3))-methyltransferase [Candidatus Dojkabacteria bacterium]|uniref:Ribosomal RNA small subunit methyltransferase E n=1 Tax=Candidatus Dojkabacteria bacterium TaxID=2099670 RepID=A0A955L4H9_9BACT|nr:16S rRNA (uracil(1498)-N(3))-methyltransferase [Candidatus Dojkabacteria bacterium]